jgi:nitroimidazol reductase NimA-like FMN-containing flavoprotein (pyridoxamine 5'-phosphate oxidase superfamily)
MALTRLGHLDLADCVELLGSGDVGRVVFSDRALPAVLPFAYVVDRDSVVLRAGAGSRLVRAAEGSVLAFEVDEIGTVGGWSVVVTGQARCERDAGEHHRLGALLPAWIPERPDVFIRIPLSLVTGRRVQRPARAAQPVRAGSRALAAGA